MLPTTAEPPPFEMNGWVKTYPFYFRWRNDLTQLRVGEHGSEKVGGSIDRERVLYDAVEENEDPWDPMTKQQWAKIIHRLYSRLDVAQFPWTFPARALNVERHDGELVIHSTWERDTFTGWGRTREEGYAAACEPIYWNSPNYTHDEQRQIHEARHIRNIPENWDTRVFPSEFPFGTS